MKTFKSIVISKYPSDLMWKTIRDQMPALAKMLDDVDRITVIVRKQSRGGDVLLTNEWRARPPLSISLKSLIGSDYLVWLDRAKWFEKTKTCSWQIEPQFFEGRIRCEGKTIYEAALGGRGSKITFEGQLEIAEGASSGVGKLVQGGVLPLVEGIVTTVIPRNFRKIVDAAGKSLDQRSSTRTS